MTNGDLIIILEKWAKEQPDRCRFVDEIDSEPVWEVFLKHPCYGWHRVSAGETWLEVVNDSKRLYAVESLIVITAVITDANPSCLREFVKLVEPLRSVVTLPLLPTFED